MPFFLRMILVAGLLVSVGAVVGCSSDSAEHKTLASFAADDAKDVVDAQAVSVDPDVSSDGAGALRITVSKPTTVQLYNLGDVDVENARLTYSARMKAKDVSGEAFLEILCGFPGRGEYFGRGLPTALKGSTDWTEQATYFFLQKGENPDSVKLNLVINGAGTVWIDAVKLEQGPLQ